MPGVWAYAPSLFYEPASRKLNGRYPCQERQPCAHLNVFMLVRRVDLL